MSAPAPDQKQMLYFADPMCSWCWGFSPVIIALAESHGDRLPIRPVMGGLKPGAEKPMNQSDKDEIKTHWEHVQEGTGQPFNFGFFERDGFIYDTEPACRAIVLARNFGVSIGLALLARLQKAFYAENQDITSSDTLIALALEVGCREDTFPAAYDSDAIKKATQADFQITQQLGITGFPTLLAGTVKEGFGIVTSGYSPLEAIAEPITAWLEEQPD